MTAEIFPDIQLIEAFEDMPAGARGTILDTHPKIGMYTIEFDEPERCVRTVPMHIVADGIRVRDGLSPQELSIFLLHHWFPDWRDRDPAKELSHSEWLIAAGRAADDDFGEDLSHLTPDEIVKKLSD
jgi:hypothetical protein